MLRLTIALVTLASLAAVACGHQSTPHTSHRSATSPQTALSTASGSPNPAAPASTSRSSTSTQPSAAAARAQALVFARGYARYLDGTLTASALPAAAASARARAGPAIPASARAGRLRVTSLTRLPGAGSRFIAELRDRTHDFAVQLTLGEAAARAIVVGVIAPDLDSILHSHTPTIAQPAGSGSARRAATAFLVGYLPWLYGHARVAAIRDATPALIAHPPRIPVNLQGLHPRLAALGMQPAAVGWRALANVTDEHQTYELDIELTRGRGRWRATNVQVP